MPHAILFALGSLLELLKKFVSGLQMVLKQQQFPDFYLYVVVKGISLSLGNTKIFEGGYVMFSTTFEWLKGSVHTLLYHIK